MSLHIPKKILFLTPAFGGADGISMVCRQALNSCLPLSEHHGIQLEVWSLNESGEETLHETPSGVTYHYANNNKLRYASWALRESARSTKNTLVIAFHVGLARICLPIIARGGRLALFVHGIEIWRQLDRLETLATNFANTVISNSNYTLREFAKHNRQIRLDNAHVCHLGTPSVNPETFTNSDGHFALLVGRMASTEQYKGHDELIELWSAVVESVPHASLFIVGDGDDRARLEQKCRDLDLTRHVKFLGRVANERLAELYQECSFFVMPSSGEGFGLVFLEAMLAGKACIGGAGASEEIIIDGETGLIVDRHDRHLLQSSLIRLFRENETREQMGLAGARRVDQYFTEAHFHHRFRQSLGLPKVN